MPALQIDVGTDNLVPLIGDLQGEALEIQHDPPTGESLAAHDDTLHASADSFPVRLEVADFGSWQVEVINVEPSGAETSWEREADRCWYTSGATVNDLTVRVKATDPESQQTKSKTVYIKIKPKSDRPFPG